jgi:hypothetical protein
MSRILFFLIVGCVAYSWFKSWQKKQLMGDNSRASQSLKPCLHCGAYSPLSDGVMIQGRFYCGLAHAKQEGENVA